MRGSLHAAATNRWIRGKGFSVVEHRMMHRQTRNSPPFTGFYTTFQSRPIGQPFSTWASWSSQCLKTQTLKFEASLVVSRSVIVPRPVVVPGPLVPSVVAAPLAEACQKSRLWPGYLLTGHHLGNRPFGRRGSLACRRSACPGRRIACRRLHRSVRSPMKVW